MTQAGYSRLPEVGERLRDVPKGPYVGESHVNTGARNRKRKRKASGKDGKNVKDPSE